MNIISLGAGVQSTTMLLMAAHGEIGPKPDYAIFADTGWEPKVVYQHFEWLKTEVEQYSIPVLTTSAGCIKTDIERASISQTRTANMPYYVKNDDGTVGIIPRGCTQEYKIDPLNKKVRELMGYKPKQRMPPGSVTKWMGISTDEIERAKISKNKWEILRYPLIEKGMNRLDCLNWMARKGYPEPPKSSCVGCPFHNRDMWLDIKQNDPDAWNEAIEFEKTLHEHGLRGLKGKLFLHRSCVPLEQVDFQENQMTFNDFINECEGMCGV
ncbi:hypothetical protein [Aneurinibacillus aneurinilyticus]|uniref:Phosphoadenosine phosphosulphate reductase domain-containing protein n=1 Tax=Aneurinibacillus aneurinilyticus TaxID=1391 RepID=A0A848D0J2_ANEAE|nr:hypothetical protein [Aneurinibacillus aneurinilyticus]NMF00270.1 hypothetical protein [Aneurinibacillus aneurinilyticus]